MTTLMYTVMRDNQEIIQLLLNKRADTSIKNNLGYTALMLAQEIGCKSANLLIQM